VGRNDVATEHGCCSKDEQCGPTGACDGKTNICVGGLTTDRGETDFLSFFMSRQNLFSKSFADKTCVADWECDGRHLTCDGIDDKNDKGECDKMLVAGDGSNCDPTARRCTLPVRDRTPRVLEYHLA